MSRIAVTALALGALLGAGVGSLPRPELGVPIWAGVLAAIGLFIALSGEWILRQSNDLAKVRAALPLSGTVLASLFCVATGEVFLEPVLASLLLAMTVSRILTAR